ncbi:MAG: hypothetical protein AMXMBFR82_20960 [Candidatus Hydrogenedentota bacterium]
MYWSLTTEPLDPAQRACAPDGRYVLHRHRDAIGAHLDLRIETGDCLTGWRIDATALDGEPWATEKAPHDLSWLKHPGDAICLEAGTYQWLESTEDERAIALHSNGESRVIRMRRVDGLPPAAVRDIRQALDEGGVYEHDAARLITDGVTARTRALERFCGLGRELDGPSFDDTLWRKTLAQLSLDEIHVHLRAYEIRFDRKYPPAPVSQPEPLQEEGSRDPRRAMNILREPA